MSTTVLRAPSRAIALLAAAAMVASMIAFAPAAEAVETQRIFGADRFATAAEISTETFEPAEVSDVIVAAGRDRVADSLSGSGLAGTVEGPILIINDVQDAVPAATLEEIERLEPDTVHVLGGTAAVSASVFNEINNAGDWDTERIAGADRFATAALIADLVPAANDTAIIANGRGFADALSMGPLAFAGPHPILLTEADSLPAATAEALEDIDNVIIAGGTAVVSAAVQAEIDDIVEGDVSRLFGPERTATAAEIVTFLVDEVGWDLSEVVVANGRNFADALTGAPYAGSNEAPLLITNGDADLGAGTIEFVQDNVGEFDLFTFLGGPAAVPDAQIDELVELAEPVDPVVDIDAPQLVAADVAQVGSNAFTVDYTFNQPVVTAGARQANFYVSSPFPNNANPGPTDASPFAAAGNSIAEVQPAPDTIRVAFAADDALDAGLFTVAGVDFDAVRTNDRVRNVEGSVAFEDNVVAFDEGEGVAANLIEVELDEDGVDTLVATFTFDRDITDDTIDSGQFVVQSFIEREQDTPDSPARIIAGSETGIELWSVDSEDNTVTVEYNVANIAVGDNTPFADTADQLLDGAFAAGVRGGAVGSSFDGVTRNNVPASVAFASPSPAPFVTDVEVNETDDEVVFTFSALTAGGTTPANFNVFYIDGTFTSAVEVDRSISNNTVTATFPDEAINDLAAAFTVAAANGAAPAIFAGQRQAIPQTIATGGNLDFGAGDTFVSLLEVTAAVSDFSAPTGEVSEYELTLVFDGAVDSADVNKLFVYEAIVGAGNDPRGQERLNDLDPANIDLGDADEGIVVLTVASERSAFNMIDDLDAAAFGHSIGAAGLDAAPPGMKVFATPNIIPFLYE